MNLCLDCNTEFEPDKYHPYQKYCKNCIVKRRYEAIKRWRKEKGKEYMRKYMKYYRSLFLILLFIYPSVCYSDIFDSYNNFKSQHFPKYFFNLSLYGTYIKPPPYHIYVNTNNSYIDLNRISISKRGWYPTPLSDDEEVTEMGKWSLEFGSTSPNYESSLLDISSVYGWNFKLGDTVDISFGKSSVNERLALLSVNSDKFNLVLLKSFGKLEDIDYPFEDTAKIVSYPITKREGGSVKIPLSFRESSVDFEFSAVRRYDEIELKNTSGVAFLFNVNAKRFKFNFVDILEGYQSNIRTTDVGISYNFYKTNLTTLSSGFRVIDYSKNQDSRYSLNFGIYKKLNLFNITANTEIYKQGENASLTATGNISTNFFGHSLSFSRNESYTGYNTVKTNNFSLSHKLYSLTLSLTHSEYFNSTSNNYSLTFRTSPFKNFSISSSIFKNVYETNEIIRTTISSNFSFTYRLTNFYMSFSPTYESYTFSRILTKKLPSVSLGITYQRFIGGDGVTGSFTVNF